MREVSCITITLLLQPSIVITSFITFYSRAVRKVSFIKEALFLSQPCSLFHYSNFTLFKAVQFDNLLCYSSFTLFTAVQCEKPPQGTDLCNHVLAQDCSTFETEVVCGSDGVTYHNRSVYKLLHNPQCEYECYILVLLGFFH